jgi:hypothetical protein
MKNLKFPILIGSIAIFTLSIVYFIKVNNDHVECETVISTKIDKQGYKVVRTTHVCNEKYSI